MYCIVLYKCKTIVSIYGSIFSIICTGLGNVSKSSLVPSVTIVNGLIIRNEYTFQCFGTNDQIFISTHVKYIDFFSEIPSITSDIELAH